MSTALQQVERIARSPRCAVTSDAAGSSPGIVALGFVFKPDAI